MEDRTDRLAPLDRLFLGRACELAARGIGSTSPNPPVGAVLVREGRIVGEGYHHRAGTPHAEVHAIAAAGAEAHGATAYVSLEPCNHEGRTPPCARALLDAGIERVVAGTIDPNPRTRGAGIAALRAAGIRVDLADDSTARDLVEIFAHAIVSDRPYAALKMAMSLDGAIAAQPGVQQWLTGEAMRLYVRDLRVAYDAVMVGAGTVRVDDPQLTVRPPYHRLKPFVRVVACESDTVPAERRVFAAVEEYASTIVLAPAGLRARFGDLDGVADLLFVGSDDSDRLDLAAAMRALRQRGICSVLCEGGPTLGARLLAGGLIDRVYWAIAPCFLRTERAVPVLASADLAAVGARLQFDRMERVGDDVVLSGTLARV